MLSIRIEGSAILSGLLRWMVYRGTGSEAQRSEVNLRDRILAASHQLTAVSTTPLHRNGNDNELLLL